MKVVVTALALGALALSTPVFALPLQNGGHDRHDTPAPRHEQAKPGKESKQARHVRACKAKYRSYDVKRDAYRGQGGRWIKCRL